MTNGGDIPLPPCGEGWPRSGPGRPLLVSRANLGAPLPLAVGDQAWVSYAPDAAVALSS